MQKAIKILLATTVALGSFVVTSPDADARRGSGVRGHYSRPVFSYRRPVPRYYYYAPPLLAVPAARYYYSGRRGYSCAELEYRCSRGNDWACDVLDRDPAC